MILLRHSGYMVRRWRTLIWDHGFDFAAKNLFVKLERCLALAVESQIRVQ
jgi:hypothetical protein